MTPIQYPRSDPVLKRIDPHVRRIPICAVKDDQERVAGSIPGGYIYFHFEMFACFPSLQVGGAPAMKLSMTIHL